MTERTARNARAEAEAVAGTAARVLEPSPPTVTSEPWFADDPVALDGEDAVSPTSAGTRTWDDLAASDPAIAAFAQQHWLGNHKALPAVPADYVSSRDDFHRVAYGVISNARKAANGKFGLRYTAGGFGTPFFGDDEQVRVEGTELIVQRGDTVVAETLTTLARAAEVAGTVANADQAEHDTIELGDLDRALDIREDVGAFLGDWFGFGTSVLEEARLLATAPDDDLSRVQMWPGHFDPGLRDGQPRRRPSGDVRGLTRRRFSHDEPYLYVASWGEIDRSQFEYWNDDGLQRRQPLLLRPARGRRPLAPHWPQDFFRRRPTTSSTRELGARPPRGQVRGQLLSTQLTRCLAPSQAAGLAGGGLVVVEPGRAGWVGPLTAVGDDDVMWPSGQRT